MKVLQGKFSSRGLILQVLRSHFFPDAEFFKFCHMKVHQHQDKTSFAGKDRVLSQSEAKTFMSNGHFKVLDYKLKKYAGSGPGDKYAGNPMGLFLLENPGNEEGKLICAHIRFDKGQTTNFHRINLVHHKKTFSEPNLSLIYIEDLKGMKKIQVDIDEYAYKLVDACPKFVQEHDEHRWGDVKRWNMKGNETGVKKMFRLTQEHSAWEDKYLEYIERFNLPGF